MLESVDEMLSYAAAETGWDDDSKLMLLKSFISSEGDFDHGVLVRFKQFLDGRVADELGENKSDEEDPACEECGNPMVVLEDGTTHHLIPDSHGTDEWDLEMDADHVARAGVDEDDCYTVAVYFKDDQGIWRHHGDWSGVAVSLEDARALAMEALADHRIDEWTAEVTQRP